MGEMKIPVVALRGMTILPGMITHFDVSRVRSVKAVEKALKEEQKLFIVTQRNPDVEEPEQKHLFEMGIVAEIKQIVKIPHNILRVLVEGLYEARLVSLEGEDALEGVVVRADPEDFGTLPENGKEAMLRNLRKIFEGYGSNNRNISKDVLQIGRAHV